MLFLLYLTSLYFTGYKLLVFNICLLGYFPPLYFYNQFYSVFSRGYGLKNQCTAKIFGLVLGFIGVGVISSSSLTGHISVIGILLALGCAIGWALGTVFIKKTGHRVNAIWMVTIQLLIGGLCLIGFGSEFESWSSIAWSMPFVSVLLFISFFLLLQWGGLHTSHSLER